MGWQGRAYDARAFLGKRGLEENRVDDPCTWSAREVGHVVTSRKSKMAVGKRAHSHKYARLCTTRRRRVDACAIESFSLSSEGAFRYSTPSLITTSSFFRPITALSIGRFARVAQPDACQCSRCISKYVIFRCSCQLCCTIVSKHSSVLR